MELDYRMFLYDAKYRILIAKRMSDNFLEFQDKRFFFGSLKELYFAVVGLINSFLVKDGLFLNNPLKDLANFKGKYPIWNLNSDEVNCLLKIIEINNDLKKSPVEFMRNDKILILSGENYKVLTYKRYQDLLETAQKVIKRSN